MDEVIISILRNDYMPHGHCYLWKPEILWLNVIADVLIAIAYFSIPAILYFFVKRREDLEFKGIFILFSAFIFCCGITHLVSIYVIWHGAYGIHGLAKLFTAIVSCITAYKLYQSVPMALKLPSLADIKKTYEAANTETIDQLNVESKRQQDDMLRESNWLAHVGILVVDENGIIILANQAVISIFGYSVDELEGENLSVVISQITAVKDEQLVTSLFDLTVDESELNNERIIYGVKKSGQEVPIEVKFNKRIYDGKPVVFASFQDITERLSSQQALFNSENMTRSIINSLPSGLNVFEFKDNDLYFVNFNKASENILGVGLNELIGKKIQDAFPDVINENSIGMYKNIAINGGTWSHESLNYDDGKLSGIFNIRSFQSNTNTVIVLFEDVTEKHKIEESIKERDLFISNAFNSITTGVYIYNLDTHEKEHVNDSFSKITGYSFDEIHAMDTNEYLALFHDSDRQAYQNHIKNITNASFEEDLFTIEYRFLHKKGFWVWCLSQDVVFERDTQGRVIRFMGNFLDISYIKAMQYNLVDLKNAAENANKAKSEFLANMSHEIRTPMNAILGLTHLILEMELGDKQYDYLSRVESSSKSLLNVLNDILDYSKMEAGKLEIINEPFVLEEVVENSVGLFSLIAEEKKIEIIVSFSPELANTYIGDQLRISQILNNLLGNAIKFTERGYVHISVDNCLTSENGINFSIEDTGAGMTDPQREKLFESFSQADTSLVRKYGGTGLGLSISASLASLMDGEIIVKSQYGVGSTFTLAIPLLPDLSKRIPTILNDLIPMKTLIVEDNEISRMAMKKLLNSWGFDVDVCNDGEQAIEVLHASIKKNQLYQLLIVDWKMPKIDGIALVNIIQTHEVLNKHYANTIALMVSAYGRHSIESHSSKNYIKAFFTKPIINSKLKNSLISLQSGVEHYSLKHAKKQVLPQFNGAMILLVEDIKTNQLVATEFLNLFDVSIIIANNGEEAVNLFEQHTFDLVLMDLQMPIMDGYTATRKIISTEKGKKTPIVAMSAAVMSSDIEKVKQCGMKDHIAKPIEIENLSRVLSEWLTPIQSSKNQQVSSTSNVSVIDININKFQGIKIRPATFNTQLALQRLGGNELLYGNILKSFYNEFIDTPDKVMLHWEKRELDSIRIIVHSIKGLANTFGAYELEQIAQHIEKQIIYVQLEDIENFVATLKLNLNYIKNALPKPRRVDIDSLSNVEGMPVDEAYEALNTILDNGQIFPLEQLKNEYIQIIRLIPKDLQQDFFDCIDSLKYKDAQEILRKIKM